MPKSKRDEHIDAMHGVCYGVKTEELQNLDKAGGLQRLILEIRMFSVCSDADSYQGLKNCAEKLIAILEGKRDHLAESKVQAIVSQARGSDRRNGRTNGTSPSEICPGGVSKRPRVCKTKK